MVRLHFFLRVARALRFASALGYLAPIILVCRACPRLVSGAEHILLPTTRASAELDVNSILAILRANANAQKALELRGSDSGSNRVWKISFDAQGWCLSDYLEKSLTKPVSSFLLDPTADALLCDHEYIYDIRAKTRIDCTELVTKARATIGLSKMLVLANVSPESIFADANLELAGDGMIGQTRCVRLRVISTSTVPKGNGQSFAASQWNTTPTVEFFFDPVRQAIIQVSVIDQFGSGNRCQASVWERLNNSSQLPSVLISSSLIGGNVTPGTSSIETTVDAAPLGQSTLLAEARRSRLAVPCFTVPSDYLQPASLYAQRLARSASGLTDASALAEAEFIDRQLGSGLEQWRRVESKLTSIEARHSLIAALAPLASEAAWFVANDKTGGETSASSVVAVLEKLSSSTDDSEWYMIAPKAMFAWEAVRDQPTLRAAERANLYGAVLERLCRSGNVSVGSELILLAESDVKAGPLINLALDRAAAAPLDAKGYIGSPLSVLVAAAVRTGEIGRAKDWVTNANPLNDRQTDANANSVRHALTLGTNFEKQGSSNLVDVIGTFDQLDSKDFRREISSAAVCEWLVDLGAQRVLQSASDESSLKTLIASTASVLGGFDYWTQVVSKLMRQRNVPARILSVQTLTGDQIGALAENISEVFHSPNYKSSALVQLALASQKTAAGRVSGRHDLDMAAEVAPDDSTRYLVASAYAQFFMSLNEPDVARARVEDIRKRVKDDSIAKRLGIVLREIDQEIAERVQRESAEELVIERTRREGTLELVRLQLALSIKQLQSPENLSSMERILKQPTPSSSW